MKLRTKLFLLNSIIILLFIGNIIYLLVEINSAANASKELQEKDLQITIYAERLKFDTAEVQQSLSEISATRAAPGYNGGFDKAEEYANDFRDTIKKLESLDSEKKDDYIALLSSFDSYYDIGKKMAQGYIFGGSTLGNEMMANFGSHADDINNNINQYVNVREDTISKKILLLEQETNKAKLFSLISVIVTTILTFLLSFFMIHPIIKAIQQLKVRSREYANGDLTQPITLNVRMKSVN